MVARRRRSRQEKVPVPADRRNGPVDSRPMFTFPLTSLLAVTVLSIAPGEFYGPRGARHVRVALTATDERIAAAVQRLAS